MEHLKSTTLSLYLAQIRILVILVITLSLIILPQPLLADKDTDTEETQEQHEIIFAGKGPEGTPELRLKLLLLQVDSARKSNNCHKAWFMLFEKTISDEKDFVFKARREMYSRITDEDETKILYPPSIAKDDLTYIYHKLILAAHSKPLPGKNIDISVLELFETYLPESNEKTEFLQCINDEKDTNCADILVSEHIIPDYYSFYQRNMLLWRSGFQASCEQHIENENVKEREVQK